MRDLLNGLVLAAIALTGAIAPSRTPSRAGAAGRPGGAARRHAPGRSGGLALPRGALRASGPELPPRRRPLRAAHGQAPEVGLRGRCVVLAGVRALPPRQRRTVAAGAQGARHSADPLCEGGDAGRRGGAGAPDPGRARAARRPRCRRRDRGRRHGGRYAARPADAPRRPRAPRATRTSDAAGTPDAADAR